MEMFESMVVGAAYSRVDVRMVGSANDCVVLTVKRTSAGNTAIDCTEPRMLALSPGKRMEPDGTTQAETALELSVRPHQLKLKTCERRGLAAFSLRQLGHQADSGLLGRFQGVSDTSGASSQALATGIHIYSGRNGLTYRVEGRFQQAS